MKTALYIVGTIVIASLSAIGIYRYAPLSWLEVTQTPKFGATITTINGSDTLSSSRTTINNNFSNLNTQLLTVTGTTTNSTITTLSGLTTASALATIGTITSGTWYGTAVVPTYGGTGSTTLSANQVLLGNGTGNIGIVSGWGTSGQALISNGGTSAPTWQSASFDQTGNYTLTGIWNWSTGLIGIGTSSPYVPFAYVNSKPAVFSTLFATSTSPGNATSTFAGNLVVGINASTTNLVISGTCTKGNGLGCNQSNIVAGTSGSASTGNGAFTTETATCPTGQIASGGGGTTNGGTGSIIVIVESYPSASNVWTTEWQAGVSGGGTGATVQAYAVCINP